MLRVDDDVVGGYGLDVTDERIQWWPVNPESQHRKESATGVLERWDVTSNLRCVIHIKLEAKAGQASEKIHATFDVREIAGHCVK